MAFGLTARLKVRRTRPAVHSWYRMMQYTQCMIQSSLKATTLVCLNTDQPAGCVTAFPNEELTPGNLPLDVLFFPPQPTPSLSSEGPWKNASMMTELHCYTTGDTQIYSAIDKCRTKHFLQGQNQPDGNWEWRNVDVIHPPKASNSEKGRGFITSK